MLKESGYSAGGAVHPDEAQDKKLIRKMVKPEDLKRKHGGKVEGAAAEARPDKRARGGGLKAITINVGGSGGAQQAVQAHQDGVKKGLAVGAQLGAKAVASKMGAMGGPPGAGPGGPPPPPGPPPGPGGPPMMAGPPGGMPMHADGGEVHVREHVRRRAGGGVETC